MSGSPLSYAYLGPEATFTEAAMLQVARPKIDTPIAHTDVVTALESVRSQRVDRAVVPIENSIEGGVTATIDSLATGDPLVIIGEVIVPVTFVLAVRPHGTSAGAKSGRVTPAGGGTSAGATSREITSVGSHPHALAQCRQRLASEFSGATHVTTLSTGAAAKDLAAGTANYDAALCAPIAAEQYGLDVVATTLEDNIGGFTRFAIVSRPGPVGEPTGSDRTSLVVHLPHDQAGALLQMLEQFAVRGVNLSRIESRPTGDAGRYAFSIDAEAHLTDERMTEVLIGLHRVCPRVRFLGSYPRADNVVPLVLPGTSSKDFTAAREWVAALKSGEMT